MGRLVRSMLSYSLSKDNYTAIPATQGGDAGIEGLHIKVLSTSVTARNEIILIMNYMSINATSLLQI